jgi:hypothetical protein
MMNTTKQPPSSPLGHKDNIFIDYWYLWLSGAVVVGYSLVATFLWGHTYWDGAIGNFAATLLGIVIGLPVAFRLERWQQKEEDQKQADDKKKRAKVVAALIREELKENLTVLHARAALDELIAVRYKYELWQALAASGELQMFDNPAQLKEVANAYHFIKISAALDSLAYEMLRNNAGWIDKDELIRPILDDEQKFRVPLQLILERVPDLIKTAYALEDPPAQENK